MCRPATCSTCNKPTYAGCGMHIEQVLGHVPRDQRCKCREAQQQAGESKPASWWTKLVGG